jgi:hypothetical protein
MQMRARLTLVFAAALGGTASAERQGGPPPAGPPATRAQVYVLDRPVVFRTGTRLIVRTVTVKDADGRPVEFINDHRDECGIESICAVVPVERRSIDADSTALA